MLGSEFSRGIWGPGRPSTECLRCAGFHPGTGDAAVSTAEARSQPPGTDVGGGDGRYKSGSDAMVMSA